MILEKEMLEELELLETQGLIDRWTIKNGEIGYIGQVGCFCYYDVIKIEEWRNILKTINKKMEWWLK